VDVGIDESGKDNTAFKLNYLGRFGREECNICLIADGEDLVAGNRMAL